MSEETQKPDLTRVPMMQRRRLGTLARTVFHVLDRCANTLAQEPVIFSSYMGEIQRTQEILECIAADRPVSPMAFSLSVHNAIGGQWSLIHGIKAPMIALSPPGNSPVPALLEGLGILQEDIYPAVNIVYYEEAYPQFYDPFLSGPERPSALAVRIVPPRRDSGSDCLTLNLEQLPPEPHVTVLDGNQEALRHLLSGQCTDATVTEAQCRWQLRRCS